MALSADWSGGSNECAGEAAVQAARAIQIDGERGLSALARYGGRGAGHGIMRGVSTRSAARIYGAIS